MAKTAKHISRERKVAAVSKQEQLRHKRYMRAFGLFLALLIAFAAGFLVRSQPAFVSSLGFPVNDGEQNAASPVEVKTTYESISARIAEVEDLFSESSVSGYDLTAATEGMIAAMMQTTGDPYATYFTPERYSAYVRETADRSYAGVGVLFSDYNGRAYVADVFEGSEAEAKGVMQGDVVIAVDGDASIEWSMTETLKALDREDGESVVITWMRPSSLDAAKGTEYTTSLSCREYEVTNVSSSLEGEVGSIKIRQFTQNSAELVEAAVSELAAQGAVSFVLDVRDNPGGYLTQAVDIASLFIPSGVVVEIQTAEGVTTKTASGVTITDAPVVVIANDYTSAAAEVLAAALQDNQRAVVVGSTTLGKGSVQVVRELSFGGAVRYTAAYYLTPLGHDINGVGVVPDVAVSGADAQYRIAVETARSFV